MWCTDPSVWLSSIECHADSKLPHQFQGLRIFVFCHCGWLQGKRNAMCNIELPHLHHRIPVFHFRNAGSRWHITDKPKTFVKEKTLPQLSWWEYSAGKWLLIAPQWRNILSENNLKYNLEHLNSKLIVQIEKYTISNFLVHFLKLRGMHINN
jgi:hypothetical protein